MSTAAIAVRTAPPVPAPPPREELFAECQDIAQSPSILDRLIERLNWAGFAGEERASKLIYLALVSRLFQKPVSIAVKGPSSAGKSHTAQQVLNFFPVDSYYALTAMSPKALAYLEEPMKNRFLVIYEADGMGDGAAHFIRTLLSEGHLNYETLGQSDGGWKPKTLRVEGPTGLLTTTTRISLHPENETRMMSVSVNDSPEQTRRIVRAMALGTGSAEINYAPWHALQAWLAQGSASVSIPFAEQLADKVFVGTLRVRRDFQKVLTLIRAHALLHQASRGKTEDGAVVATLADYQTVRDLTLDLLGEAAGQSVADTVREAVAAVALLGPSHFGGVPLSAVAAHLGLDKSSTSRRVKAATEDGYLVNEELREGRPAKLKLGDPLPQEQEILPEPEVLLAA